MVGNGRSRVLVLGDAVSAAPLARRYEQAGFGPVRIECSSLPAGAGKDYSVVHILRTYPLEGDSVTRAVIALGAPVALPFSSWLSLSELENVVVRFERAGLPLMLAYPPLYAESFHRLQHSISTGFAGKVSEIALDLPGTTEKFLIDLRGGDPGNDACVGLSYLALLAGGNIEWLPGMSGPSMRISGEVSGGGTALSAGGYGGRLPRIVVKGEASTLTLSFNGQGHVLEAARNGVSRVLARFVDEDLLTCTVKAVQRFVDNRTRRIVSGHAVLFLRQAIESLCRRAQENVPGVAPQADTGADFDESEDDGEPYEVYRKLPPAGKGDLAGTLWEAKINIERECNQNCVFCFARDGDVQPVDLSEAPRFFGRLTAQGIEGVMFSGREPTLNDELTGYIKQAKEAGLSNVTVETNALLFSDPGFATNCRVAGLDAAFVSFHSARPETVDLMTRTPGSFERTLAGIRNLVATGVAVELNCVITQHNFRELETLPTYVSRELKGVRSMTFSFVAPLARAYMNAEVVPRISDIAPHLSRTLAKARSLGIVAQVPGRCGIPLCFLPGQEDFFVEYRLRRPVTRPGNGGSQDRVKVKHCGECPYDSYCQGLWLTYAEMYGTSEIEGGLGRLLASHNDSLQAE